MKYIFLLLLPLFFGCKGSQQGGSNVPKDEIEVIFLQINDVYEIAPLEGGKSGGMARVATVYKNLKKENPNTIFVLAGDFLSPSVFSTLNYNGERIKGKQMVEALNAAGLDLVTFGNHEFDMSYEELKERIFMSDARWISSNVLHKMQSDTVPFYEKQDEKMYPIPETIILDIAGRKDKNIRVGILAVTLPMNQVDYVYYQDIYDAAQTAFDTLNGKVNYTIALTHLGIDQDQQLARQLPELELIMGGHDHDNMYIMEDGVPIAKADANAKTVYIHRVRYNIPKDSVYVISELKTIDDKIPMDSATAAVVAKWMNIAEEAFSDQNFQKDEVITFFPEPYDGRESSVRNHPTNLGKLIAHAIADAARHTDVAIVNGGAIRLDDQLQGEITQYDVLRTLPFGGNIVEVEMKGELLLKILEAGIDNKGTGGFLHWYNLQPDSRRNAWFVENDWLDHTKYYTVAMPAFLLTGQERNMAFLTPDNPMIRKIYEPKASDDNDLRNDIRRAVINYLRKGGK